MSAAGRLGEDGKSSSAAFGFGGEAGATRNVRGFAWWRIRQVEGERPRRRSQGALPFF